MIGTVDVKKALIARLTAVATPVTTIPADIAEFNYQGAQFTYPCVRVRVGPLSPRQRAGSCQPMDINFEIIAYSENPNSEQVSTIAEDIENSFKNVRLVINGKTANPVRVLQIIEPLPLPEQRGWVQHILMSCEVPDS